MVVNMATKNKPTEVAGKSGEPEALSGGTAVEKAAEVPKESAPKVAVPTATVDKADQRGSKRPAESREPVQKRARTSTALDIAAPFVIQSKVKDAHVPLGASALKEPGVTLSLAEAIILPADRDIRRAEDDALAIARVVQSAIKTAKRIADIGRHLRNVDSSR
ncbi:uncharacterized protein LOC114303545 [Camellia sinensis]|uniref:uncharacterized protein LOC114303545 n=1 Tax=Camellia sinensis TaxID=4442 RepID=UPI00103623CD|nr:uncharacterized protein LOC114303545 [Camellia sinensis]